MNATVLKRWLGLILLTLLLTESAHAFYNPDLGRWINRDPADDWGSTVNRVQNIRASDIDFRLDRFVGNAPTIYVDEFGLTWRAGGQSDDKDDTIACNGNGNIRVALTKTTLLCGCEREIMCKIAHELSHAHDALDENPDICKGKRDGTEIYTRSSKQLNESERKAYDRQMDCVRNSTPEQGKDCVDTSEQHIEMLKKYRQKYE